VLRRSGWLDLIGGRRLNGRWRIVCWPIRCRGGRPLSFERHFQPRQTLAKRLIGLDERQEVVV
jgi:hypothetical protein